MRRLLIVTGLVLTACLTVLVSCGSAPAAPKEETIATESYAGQTVDADYEMVSGDEGEMSLAIDEERMIVRTGNMSLVVEDVVTTIDGISQLAASLDGYVVSSNIWGIEQEMRGRISIRVPDDSFEQTMGKLRDIAVRVDSESTDSRDVTEEYMDLEARLRNEEATENQYLVLMEEAKDIDDILSISDRLSRVRRDIEQIKGRMQYLERTTSMSLIDVSLTPAATTKPLVRVGWSLSEVLKTAARGFIIFGQALGTAAVWLLIFIPFWGIPLGIFLWRRHKRKKANEKPEQDA